MITKRDVLWGGVGMISLAVLVISACRLFSLVQIPWTSVLVVMVVGSIAGGIPYLPSRILSKYRTFWFSLGMVACGILFFWQRRGPLSLLGPSIAWLVAATGYFVRKWRSQTTPNGTEEVSRDSQNAEP